jgi:hypothetical protein
VFLIGLFFHVYVEVDGRRGREDVGKKSESREQREVSSLFVDWINDGLVLATPGARKANYTIPHTAHPPPSPSYRIIN